MNEIKDIIEYCEIEKKREKLNRNKVLIPHIKRLMSDLCININVSKYAYYKSNLQSENSSETEREYYLEELNKLSKDKNVLEYIEFEKYLNSLYEEIIDYYRTIQEELRYELLELDTPDIYVLQKSIDDNGYKEAKHIINKDAIVGYKGSFKETLIMPNKINSSKRKNRHFYNQVSFRYLEELSKDCTFDLETKNIGKVKILK